jgi:hypothetical protein
MAMAGVSVLTTMNPTARSTVGGTRGITLGPIGVVATGTAVEVGRAPSTLLLVVEDRLQFLQVGAAALMVEGTAVVAAGAGVKAVS